MPRVEVRSAQGIVAEVGTDTGRFAAAAGRTGVPRRPENQSANDAEHGRRPLDSPAVNLYLKRPVGWTPRRRRRDAWGIWSMLKPSDNPPQLSPSAVAVSDLPGRWWIAHTKARSEKAFAWDLIAAGTVGYYLPMARRTTFSGGRKRLGFKPLFTSYVFVCGDAECRPTCLKTGRLCAVLPVPDQPQLVAELSAVHRALAGSPELDLYPFAAVGRRCRVTAGPLMGMQGIVVRRTERATLVLEVSILRQGAALEVDLSFVEPIGDD